MTAAPVVFVVDDDASVRSSLKFLLSTVGLQAETFDSADGFLHKKRADVPSCLVLDVRLPGLSGLDFQRELATRNICIPIVFLTGHGDIPMSVRAMKAGAVEFLTKPFRDQDLLDAVHVALDRDRARREQEEEITDIRGAIRLSDFSRAGSGFDGRCGNAQQTNSRGTRNRRKHGKGSAQPGDGEDASRIPR